MKFSIAFGKLLLEGILTELLSNFSALLKSIVYTIDSIGYSLVSCYKYVKLKVIG